MLIAALVVINKQFCLNLKSAQVFTQTALFLCTLSGISVIIKAMRRLLIARVNSLSVEERLRRQELIVTFNMHAQKKNQLPHTFNFSREILCIKNQWKSLSDE